MRNYCSLWDSKYAAKGLAMYESLKRQSSEDFMLNVLPLDRETEDVLTALQLSNLIVLSERAFVHDQRLEKIKETRSRQHYAWTCASNLCEWLLFCPDCELAEISYIDADCYWMADPKIMFAEIGDRSIGIIPHRFIPSKQYLEVNGQFNVGWVTFKNTEAGRACLSRWAAQVRNNCDSRTCGDQKYLDDWPENFKDHVCIIQNIGANVAPWNVGNYELIHHKNRLYVAPLMQRELYGNAIGHQVVFYHFHEYEHGQRLTNYELRPEDIELIYKPYIKAINEAQLSIVGIHA